MGIFGLFSKKVRTADSFGPHCRGLTVRAGRSVYFLDESRGIRRLIIDERGYFHGFPGALREKCWTVPFGKRQLAPRAQYYTSVSLQADGRWLILWTIQPDGMVGSDGGFGIEDDEEIILYAHLDQDGRFTGPFSVYSVGDKEYFQRRSR